MPARHLTACVLVCALACLAPPPGQSRDDEFDAAVKKFAADKAALQADAVRKLDAACARAMAKASTSASARQSLKVKWDKEKQDFLNSDQLPAGADFADLALDYGLKVSKAYKPLAARFDALVGAAQKRGDSSGAADALARRIAFEQKTLPGAKELTAGSVWVGTRYGGANPVPARLAVKAVEGTVGSAVYAQNMAVVNHSVVEVGYELDGMAVKGGLTKVRQGGMKALKFEGVVVGNTMVLAALGSGGVRVNGAYVILTKQGGTAP